MDLNFCWFNKKNKKKYIDNKAAVLYVAALYRNPAHGIDPWYDWWAIYINAPGEKYFKVSHTIWSLYRNHYNVIKIF